MALFSAAPLRNVVVGFLVAFVVQYLVAGWIVVLVADPLDASFGDEQPAKARSPAPVWHDDSKTYTSEDFLADSQRARAQSPGYPPATAAVTPASASAAWAAASRASGTRYGEQDT